MDQIAEDLGRPRSASLTCLQELQIKIQEKKDLEAFVWVLEDRFLLHFVRSSKYDSDKALNVLENYIGVRKRWKEMFREMIPSKTKQMFRVLNHRGPQGQLIVVMRDCWWDPSELSADDLLRSGMLNYEEVWNDVETERNGVIGVWDTKGFSYTHAIQFTPRQIHKMASIFIKAFPMRITSIHVLNVPIYFKTVVNAAKYLLPSKFKNKMLLHGRDLSSFHEHFPQRNLPLWLGGELSDEDALRQDIFPNILKKEEYYAKFARSL